MNHDKNPYEKDFGYSPEFEEDFNLGPILVFVAFELILIGIIFFQI
jgi:hypothetical protein